jgi:hypothetical protein
MKLFIPFILLVFLVGCSEKKEVIKIKSVFEIPENVSEESLINFGFKKRIPKEEEYTFIFGKNGHKIYEKHLKYYSTCFYKKGTISSEIRFVQGTIMSMHVSMDTIIWNELDKKISQTTVIDTVYSRKDNKVHYWYTNPHFAEIAGYKYKCQLPLKKEDAWKQGAYYNPVTKKKMFNYSKSQFHTVSLKREFTGKHQDKLKRIMEEINSRF